MSDYEAVTRTKPIPQTSRIRLLGHRWPTRGASTAPRDVVQHRWGGGQTDDKDDFSRIRLEDGRFIDVRVSGPADGPLLIFHHGTPGAGTPIRAVERAAHARGLRVATTSLSGVRGFQPRSRS